MPSDRDLAIARSVLEASDKLLEQIGFAEDSSARNLLGCLNPAAIVAAVEDTAGDDDGYSNCSVCGRPVRYGTRHHTCGSSVMDMEKRIAELERQLKEARATAGVPRDGGL